MNLRLDLHIVGWLLALVGLFQLLPVAVAVVYGEPWLAYGLSSAIVLTCGLTDSWSLAAAG